MIMKEDIYMSKKTSTYLTYKLKDMVIPQKIIDNIVIDDAKILLWQKNIEEILYVVPLREKAFIANIGSMENIYELQELIPHFEKEGWDIYIEVIDPHLVLHRMIFRKKNLS